MKISELINPSERQKECLEALRKHRFVLYGGAMAGGKSYLLRWWCVRQCIYYHAKYGIKGVRVGLFSMDFPTLKSRQISKMLNDFPAWLGKIADTQSEGFIFKLNEKLGGGIIALCNLDDASKYKSAEFASIGVEELTENQEDVFHKLRNRMRWAGIPTQDTHFLGCTNPGGPGHAWVKSLWIDKDIPPNLEILRNEFVYVKAKASDNPHIDEEYKRQNLDTLPEEMRRAYAEGDWDLFEGQYFSEWRKEIHVCEPFEIPWFWRIERCGDWGESNPCAHLWVATDPHARKFVIGEVYGAGMRIKEQAERIKAFEAGKAIRKVGILDGACFDPTGRDKSIAAQFAEFGVQWAASVKSGAAGRIKSGAQVMRTQLSYERDADGKVTKEPNLKVFSTCKDFIRTVPSLIHDPINPESYTGEDHACFEAETMIATPSGDKPIWSIIPGDVVLSPLGTCKVLSAGYTGRRSVVCSAGLIGTGDHPLIIGNKTVRLDALRYTDCIWKRRESCSMASPTGVTQTQQDRRIAGTSRRVETRAKNRFTGRFGRASMALYRMVATFTTSMGIPAITTLSTSNACLGSNTYRSTASNVLPILSTLPESDRLRSSGTGQRLAESGIECMVRVLGLEEPLPRITASSAARALKRLREASSGFVATHARRPTGWLVARMMKPALARRVASAFASIDIGLQSVAVGHAPEPCGVMGVYNLATEHGCYFANGVLVSNCDALRYHLVGTAGAPETPEEAMSTEEAAMLAQADKQYQEMRQ